MGINGKIEINEWQKVVRIIFEQMVECIEFIHSKNVCHFDISLENWLIDDVEIEVDEYYDTKSKAEKVRFSTDGIQIKLCGFGLAQMFKKNECFSSKYCGKKVYICPEIVSRKIGYNAKKSDIWSLGVCLFMMSTGLAPWDIAAECDEGFVYIMKHGQTRDLLEVWEVEQYVDDDWIDLIDAIFEFETYRTDIKNIKNHQWMH